MMANAAIPYFFYSFGILLREGLEAMLVIIALAAGARNAGGGRDGTRDVYVGATVAIVASIIIALLVRDAIGDDASDTLEGLFP